MLPVAVASNDSSLIDKALGLELHQSRTWHQLLHVESSSRSPTGIESQVDDVRYFLAQNGKTDVEAELLASIDALLVNPDEIVDDNHPRCRFVAREVWLRSELGLSASEVPPECALYHQWRDVIGSHSMSLVFPASYLNSPSSMFGHTLLRLDPKNIEEGSPWLSWSLNFAADTGSENFSAGYALKGIAGGYAGKFNTIPYFKKLQEYGAIENRDIWEYKLDFNEQELARMLDHVWELRDINFDYYFFRQNCSYRLLELMDYARPSLNLASQFRLTTIPADTVKAVVRADIVSDTHYRASLGTGIQSRYQAIPRHLRPWVEQISTDAAAASTSEFTGLDVEMQASIVRVANDLITYRSRLGGRSKAMAQRRLSLLKLMSQYSIDESAIPIPEPPEIGHDTRTVTVGGGRIEKQDYTELGFRWSYHDLLDRNNGYLKGAGIVLSDIKFRRHEDGKAQLQSFGLVELQSISDRALIFNSLSWNFSAGLVRDATRLNNRLSVKLTGSVGKSTELVRNTIGYALAEASVAQYNRLENNFVDGGVRLGVLNYFRGAAAQLELKMESRQDESARISALLNYNVPLARNHALRLTYSQSRQSANTIQSGMAQYRFYY